MKLPAWKGLYVDLSELVILNAGLGDLICPVRPYDLQKIAADYSFGAARFILGRDGYPHSVTSGYTAPLKVVRHGPPGESTE